MASGASRRPSRGRQRCRGSREEGAQGAGDIADDGRTPGEPHEPSDALYNAACDPTHVHVDPGGSAYTERNGSLAHERADIRVDGEVLRASRDVQYEAERSRTRRGDPIEGERPSALAHGQLTVRADENDQNDEEIVNNIPEGPPDPPPPPDEPVNRQNESPSIELEGERKGMASTENARTSDEVDALGASGHVEGLKRAEETWKRARTRQGTIRAGRGELPDGSLECPYDPGGETAVPRGVQVVQECPTGVRNERVVETNALR